jgi:hypothetical protein
VGRSRPDRPKDHQLKAAGTLGGASSSRRGPSVWHNRAMRGVLWLVSLFAFSAQGVAAQGLGEAAKREQERRDKNKKIGLSAPSFTDESVKHASPSPKTSPSPATGSAPAASMSGALERSPGASEMRVREEATEEASEAGWRARLAAARARVTAAQRRVERAKADWWPPAGASSGEGPAIAAFQAETREAENELRAAKAALSELEERARREGVPPGWLR